MSTTTTPAQAAEAAPAAPIDAGVGGTEPSCATASTMALAPTAPPPARISTLERRAASKRAAAIDALTDAITVSMTLAVPDPVTEITPRKRGVAPKLSPAALELARQVYYLQHGSVADAARAIVAEGLADTDEHLKVYERLITWWAREKWPKRPITATLAIRDANSGSLYRAERTCAGTATGNGPASKGQPCTQSALTDSDYCHQHDPRAEYVEARRRNAERLTAGRRALLVPAEPMRQWCEYKRRQLLQEARERGPVHHNNQGWGLLADAMNVDQSLLSRLVDGIGSRGQPTSTLKATSVQRYLEPLGVTFQDVYGYDPPGSLFDAKRVCSQCGSSKNVASALCRTCHEQTLGEQCAYVNRRGEQCAVNTKDPSGYCGKCRRIVHRKPRPRTGRPSYVSVAMLTLATGKYAEVPKLAWVARQMWAANAGGVRDVFASNSSLTSALVKQFRKRNWGTPSQVAAAHQALVDEHGAIPWPTGGEMPLEAAGMVEPAPFLAWLAVRHKELGSYAQLSQRLRLNPDNISKWLRGKHNGALIRRATVDQALEHWGDGTTFADVYVKEHA